MRGCLPNEPAEPWTAHVRWLRDVHGMTYVAQAEACGLPLATVYGIAHGRGRSVYADTAARLASIVPPPWPPAPAGMAYGVGPRRRCQALARVGHAQKAQREALGMSNRRWFELVTGVVRFVPVARAEKIAALYDEWCNLDGPSAKTVTWAVKAGWFGPEAWPDDTIDDPAAEPLTVERADPLVVEQVLGGTTRFVACRRVDRLAIVAALVADGCGTPRAIATRVRSAPETIGRLLAEVTG